MSDSQRVEGTRDQLINERMPLPTPGKASAALLKKRKRQAHRRSEAFYADKRR